MEGLPAQANRKLSDHQYSALLISFFLQILSVSLRVLKDNTVMKLRDNAFAIQTVATKNGAYEV